MSVEYTKISFDKETGDFASVLRRRVNTYFKESNCSFKADKKMYSKSLFLVFLVLCNYIALLTFDLTAIPRLLLCISLGFFVATGTMNIVHDALHGAYVKSSWGNRFLGFLMDVFGTSSFYWKQEHVVDHHTYTNIKDHDKDLDVPIVLRLCPDAPYRWYHRYQHIYAPLLYSVNLISWVYLSDAKRLYYAYVGTKPLDQKELSKKEAAFFIFFKILHVLLFLVLPTYVLGISFWKVFFGYALFLATLGATITVIFQLAHIVENVAFPTPSEQGKIDNSFERHQFATTANFATKSRLVHFLFGGLNFQIEHHLFPHVCHIHLNKIAPIVEQTAKEFGVPYHKNDSFFGAILSHFKTLKRLGVSP